MELQEFIKKFADQLDETDPAEITATTEFQQLEEWSSLNTLVIISFVMTEFGKSIKGAEIRSCKTVEDLYNFVNPK